MKKNYVHMYQIAVSYVTPIKIPNKITSNRSLTMEVRFELADEEIHQAGGKKLGFQVPASTNLLAVVFRALFQLTVQTPGRRAPRVPRRQIQLSLWRGDGLSMLDSSFVTVKSYYKCMVTNLKPARR
jgi:hypothetical protein